MNEAQGSARTTISIPPDLKREMGAVKESVNWSRVAAEAFRAKLTELQSTRKGTTMQDAIKRLKAAAELEASKNYAEGKACGDRWAKEEARPSQLRRLAKKVARSDGQNTGTGSAEDYVDAVANDRNRGLAVCLCLDITGWDELNVGMEEYWDSLVGPGGAEAIQDEHFARGFIEAALEVWEAAEGEL